MNNSAIIRDVGLTIANVLEMGLKGHKVKASVVLAPPVRAQFEKRTPAVAVSLIGVDTHVFAGERPQEEVIQEPRPDGSIAEYYVDPPLTMTLEYVLTGWGADAGEDAVLLGAAMKVLLECPIFEQDHIKGDSFEARDRVQLECNANLPLERRALIFQAFGEPMRGAAFYKVVVQLFSERRSPEIRRVITKHFGVIDKQTGRRLR